MADSQLTTFGQMRADLIQRVRDQTGDSITTDIAGRFLNIALHDMHVGQAEQFHWTHRRGVVLTHPSYTTGTIAVTRGDATVTGTGTLWATANDFGQDNARAAGKILAAGRLVEVSSVANDTSLELTYRWPGESDTGLSYTYFEDAYALPGDFGSPIDSKRFTTTPVVVNLVGRTEFRRRYPENARLANPEIATIVDEAPAGSAEVPRKVVLHPAPSAALAMEFLYVTRHYAVNTTGTTAENMSSDDDQPIVPMRYRHAIAFHALYHYYRDRKDDQRGSEAKAEYTDLMLRIINDSQIGESHMVIHPRAAFYRRRARRPWSSGASRFDINDRFDRLED